MLKKETIIAVLKQFWYRYQHPTKADKVLYYLMCIPMACWVFSFFAFLVAVSLATVSDLFGWLWLGSGYTMLGVFVVGRIWSFYDVIKHMKETGFFVPINEPDGKRSQ